MYRGKKPAMELLAPAGGIPQLIAAVENGADAVYLGGRLFNARMNAGNFDDETMQQAIDYAHLHGVQVHVTLNTMLRQEELQEALDYAAFLYRAGADALIVQDLGLAALVAKHMPDLPLHFSTQGTTYSLRGVEAATRLGFSRVVLARELSLPEIREICRGTETEIEVFVHGALCVCYSGQCQLSRYFGGRSGNRGVCAQPCRLPYATLDKAGRPLEAAGYPLSPKDLCLIDHLGELAEAGVTSLKIEGRMKSPEYVGVVTAIYRKYMDMYLRQGRCQVTPEDRQALTQIFNRGGFTNAYLRGEWGGAMMASDIPKHQGILIGRVKGRVKGTSLVDVALTSPLERGDGVEIRGETVCGNIVTWLERRGKDWRIGDIAGRVREGDALYRISSKSQLDAVRRTFQGFQLTDQGTRPTARRLPVTIRVIGKGDRVEALVRTEGAPAAVAGKSSGSRKPAGGRKASGGGKPAGAVKTLGSGKLVGRKQATVAANLNPALEMDTERLAAALRKSGATTFSVERVDIQGHFSGGLRVAEMNALRRRGLEALAETLRVRRELPPIAEEVQPEKYGPVEASAAAAEPVAARYEEPASVRKLSAEEIEEYHFGWPERLPAPGSGVTALVPLQDYMDHLEEARGRAVIPYVSNMPRGREETWLEDHFDQICVALREGPGVYVGTLSWIAPFREAGIRVRGDYGLNAYNSRARQVLSQLGVEDCVESLEGAQPEEAGEMPLMTLQHTPEGEYLAMKGRPRLRLVRRKGSDQCLVIPDVTEKKEEGKPHRSGIRRVYKG